MSKLFSPLRDERPSAATIAGFAFTTLVVALGASVLALTMGVELPPVIALALIGMLLVSDWGGAAPLVGSASILLAIGLVFGAAASTRLPLFVEPHYVHGGDGSEGIVLVMLVPLVFLSSTVLAYTFARWLSFESRGFAVGATAALVLITAVSGVRSLIAPAPMGWIDDQPVAFDSARAQWPAGSPKRVVLPEGVTIFGDDLPKIVFPSGQEASMFSGLHLPFVLRHATRDRLWIVVDQDGQREFAFEESGLPAGDLHLQRIARTLSAPTSSLLVLLVGVGLTVLDLRHRPKPRKRTTPASPEQDTYRDAAPLPEEPAPPPPFVPYAPTAAIACLAAAPTIGWWLGVLFG